MPSAAIPLLTFDGFEITIKRSVHHWFTFFKSKRGPRYQEECLAFVCDRIAEDFWFAQIAYRVKVDNLPKYRAYVKYIVKEGVCLGMGPDSKESSLVDEVMNRLGDELLNNQMDDKRVTLRDNSEYILNEYICLFIQNVQSHSMMGEISKTMTVVEQYLCNDLIREYNGRKPPGSSSDFRDVLASRGEDEMAEKMAMVLSNILLSNAMKELHSIEYSRNFAGKMPLKFLDELRQEFLKIKVFCLEDLKNLNQWRISLGYVLEACIPEQFDDLFRSFYAWMVSCTDSEERMLYSLLTRNSLICDPKSSFVPEIARKLETVAEMIKLPDDYEKLDQMRQKFQALLRWYLEQHKCHHLIRFVIDETRIDRKLKHFLFKPVSMMPPGTNTVDFKLLDDRTFLRNTPDFSKRITPKPFSAELRNQKQQPVKEVPSPAAIPSKTTSPGLKGGFFNKGLSSAKNSHATAPKLAESVSVSSEMNPQNNTLEDIETV
jgi:hypothetical protein